MGTNIVLLILTLVLGVWGYRNHGVLLVFSSFFFVLVRILLREGDSDASTMMLRFMIFTIIIVLQTLKGDKLSQAAYSITQNRFLLGYLAILVMGFVSAVYTGTNMSEKMYLMRNMIVYTIVPMALFSAYFGELKEISKFPVHFIVLFIITFISVLWFVDTSTLILNERRTIENLGFNSIFLSRMGAISLICSILLFYYSKRLRYRIISGVTAFLSMFSLLLSSQRASIIGFFVALLVWLKYGVKMKRNIKPILVVVILMSGVLFFNIDQFAVVDRFKDLENYQEYQRFYDYGTSWKLFTEKPIFGYGIMGYYEQTGRIYPHSIYLEVIVEYGIVGLLIYIFMISEIFGVIRRIFVKPNANLGLQAIALSWIILFVASFFAGAITRNSDFFILSAILSTMRLKRYLPEITKYSVSDTLTSEYQSVLQKH